MAAPGLITISNPQQRVKDSYASAPKIDLTVRANGEEKVMVMDAQGSWTVAGFDSPSVAPTVNTSGTGGSFTANKYWAYTYVYVAKLRYPLVENAQTGGGSPAPRTNPAPIAPANSATNTNQKILSIPTSSRNDLSHIWIYRTLTDFDTAAEALVNAEAGVMFWLGEIENNQNLATVPFTDTGSDADGEEQIENDNFTAPLFDKVVYADPYFWGFGNSVWYDYVSVDATGLVTIPTDSGNPNALGQKWYDGRNGQTISLDGITSGGYDNHGNFYFKAIDNVTAQLYSDIALQNPVGVSSIGVTKAMIRGASTVLYRSKPRNPFSWGYTDLIGDVQVPLLYNFPVGGGEGTGLAIIANQNLLKLDTERPTRCFTLNLKNAGTPNFESSLRIISESFSVSHQSAQFPAVLERGQTVLRSFDAKTFSLIDCDGASQVPASSNVYHTLEANRSNAFDVQYPSEKSYFVHGVYHAKYELNCFFMWTNATSTGGTFLLRSYKGVANKLIYQHAPTGYWGSVELFDTVCSARVYDEFTSTEKVLVGTLNGFVGELFADDTWMHWFTGGNDGAGHTNVGHGPCVLTNSGTTLTVDVGQPLFSDNFTGLIGNTVTVVLASRFYLGRVLNITNGGRTINLAGTKYPSEDGSYEYGSSFAITNGTPATYYVGLIPIEVGKTFNGQIPFDYKKIEEIHTAWVYKNRTETPTIEFYGTFLPRYSSGAHELPLITSNNSEGTIDSDGNFAIFTNIPVDIAKSFGIIIRDRNQSFAQLMSYEIRLSSPNNNGNQRQTYSR